MGMIIDLAVILLFVIMFFVMAKKGFVKAVYSLGGHILAFILTWVLLTPAAEFVRGTELGIIVGDNVSKIMLQQNNGEETSEIMNSFVVGGIENMAEQSVPIVTDVVIKVLTAIILFIVTRILVYLLFILLDTVFKFPVLSQFNKLAGGIAGIINALIIIYIVCGILSLNFEWTNDLRGFVDQTSVLKYFYLNNFLINFFV